MLHPYRRRRARRTLQRSRADSLLIVCLGNICRSPYAERRLREEFGGEAPSVTSAGFIGPGRPSPEVARRLAMARGIDLEDHRSRVLTPGMLSGAELVVVMSGAQRRDLRREFGDCSAPVILLGDLDPDPVDRRKITDPFDCSEAVFRAVFDRIDRCCRELVGAMTSETRPAPGEG